jgi:hypothetical protein
MQRTGKEYQEKAEDVSSVGAYIRNAETCYLMLSGCYIGISLKRGEGNLVDFLLHSRPGVCKYIYSRGWMWRHEVTVERET